jgi:Putative neutral zinc metallopeptidase
MSLLAILLFIGTMVLSLWATIRVRQVYNRFSLGLVPASSGSTGADAAATILRQEGISDIEIVAHDQMLGDHHDPIHKRVVLSREKFYATSVAALCCGTRTRACHPTQASLCASAMADGLGGSDNLCQPDRALAALAANVHRFSEHGYGIDPNGQRLGHFNAV